MLSNGPYFLFQVMYVEWRVLDPYTARFGKSTWSRLTTAGPRLAEFSWMNPWMNTQVPINHHKCGFYIAIDQTGRYQLPSSFNSLHIMHPTRVLQIQPTRLLLRPVPVSYAISDTLRGGSWPFIERGAQRYELLLGPSIQKHHKTLFKADPASTKHIQYHSVYVGWRKSPPS